MLLATARDGGAPGRAYLVDRLRGPARRALRWALRHDGDGRLTPDRCLEAADELLALLDATGTAAERAKSKPRRRRKSQGGPPAPEAGGRRDGAGAHESGVIPARCPVVRRPVCFYDNCQHFIGDRCAHPEAVQRGSHAP